MNITQCGTDAERLMLVEDQLVGLDPNATLLAETIQIHSNRVDDIDNRLDRLDKQFGGIEGGCCQHQERTWHDQSQNPRDP